jgi:hypothetical protein
MRYLHLLLILTAPLSATEFLVDPNNNSSVLQCTPNYYSSTSCLTQDYVDSFGTQTYVDSVGRLRTESHSGSPIGGVCYNKNGVVKYTFARYITYHESCTTTSYVPNETFFELENNDYKVLDTLEDGSILETLYHYNQTGSDTKSKTNYTLNDDDTQNILSYEYVDSSGETLYDMTFDTLSSHIDFNDGATLDNQYDTSGNLERSTYQNPDGSQSQTVYNFNPDGSGTMETLTINGDTKEYKKDTFDANGNLIESVTTQIDGNNGLSGYSSTAGLFTIDSTNNTPSSTGGSTPNYDLQQPETGVTYNGFGDSNGTLANIINLQSNAVTCDTICDDGAPAINQNGMCHCDRVCEAVNYDTVDGTCQARSNVDCASLTINVPTGFYIDSATDQNDCINKSTYSYIDSSYVAYPDYTNCPTTWFCLVHDVEENPIDPRIQEWIDNYNNNDYDPNGDNNDNGSDGDNTDNGDSGGSDDNTDSGNDSNTTDDNGGDTNGTVGGDYTNDDEQNDPAQNDTFGDLLESLEVDSSVFDVTDYSPPSSYDLDDFTDSFTSWDGIVNNYNTFFGSFSGGFGDIKQGLQDTVSVYESGFTLSFPETVSTCPYNFEVGEKSFVFDMCATVYEYQAITYTLIVLLFLLALISFLFSLLGRIF